MRAVLEKLVVGLVSAALIALVGWTYAVNSRVATLEAQRDGMAASIAVIREDVRELRRKLIGDVP